MKKRTFILTALTVITFTMTGCQTAPKENAARIADQTKTAAQMNADAPVSSPAAASERSSSKLTDADAKEIAFKDAGLKEYSVTHIRVQKDYDDGVTVYDVEFYAGTTEYDYEIDASTGEIRSRDFDIEHDFNSDKTETSGSTDLLSEEKASKLVLSKVEGASAQNLRIVLEHDDGQEIYEGEIRYNGMEYEFELNAKTGDILEWSQEREDD